MRSRRDGERITVARAGPGRARRRRAGAGPGAGAGAQPPIGWLLFAPATVFLNAAARDRLPADRLRMQVGLALARRRASPARVARRRRAAGGDGHRRGAGPVRPRRHALAHRRAAAPRRRPRRVAAPHGAARRRASRREPGDATQRVGNLSRAYRVNLTVLALVALFTGAFLVFSVLSLSVARRAQQFALLGVLGLTARQRRALVLAESAVLGLVGSVAGIALGTVLAALALAAARRRPGRRLFPGRGAAPAMEHAGSDRLRRAGRRRRGGRRLVAGAGRRSACRWRSAQGPARGRAAARRGAGSGRRCWSLACLLALLPPVAGLPLAAYVSVGLLLVGGIASLPPAVGAALRPAGAAAWRGGCCPCWRSNAPAACARRPPSRSAAWWPR